MGYDRMLSKAINVYGQDDERCIVRVSGLAEATGALFERLKEEVSKSGVEAVAIRAGSFGYYDLEPIIAISKPGKPTLLYARATGDVLALVNDYLTADKASSEGAFCTMRDGGIPGILRSSDLPLFSAQHRVALRNCGLIDPEEIDHYIAVAHGYSGLARVLGKDRAEAVEALKSAGLSAAANLQVLSEAGGGENVVVCNAVDASPGSLTARLLLEGDPHGVIEGMLIAAYAAGAGRCIIVADNRWTVGIERMTKALAETGDRGLAGDAILGTSFSCRFEIAQAVPSLIMAEDTALLRFLEGKQPLAVLKPDPGPLSLAGNHCLVETVETFARISGLFQEAGQEGPATRVTTLTGDVSHGYTIEVPVETTIRTLVEDIGGGAAGRALKAIQLGPTGRLLGPENLDLPFGDGSATLEVFDETHCAVEMAEERMTYLQTQSCGKCVFCREGTFQMSDILKSVTAGEGTPRDLELIGELGEAMRTGSICAIGASAANPVLSGMSLFREEYEEHIREKRCKK